MLSVDAVSCSAKLDDSKVCVFDAVFVLFLFASRTSTIPDLLADMADFAALKNSVCKAIASNFEPEKLGFKKSDKKCASMCSEVLKTWGC